MIEYQTIIRGDGSRQEDKEVARLARQAGGEILDRKYTSLIDINSNERDSSAKNLMLLVRFGHLNDKTEFVRLLDCRYAQRGERVKGIGAVA